MRPPTPALAQPNYTVYATTRTFYSLDAASFRFEAAGFSDDILDAAFARYAAVTFGYGPGGGASAAAAGAPTIPGVRVDVLSSDDALFEGVDESYSLLAPDPDPAAAGWASITAATVFGALRGLETLSQLVMYNFTDGAYSMAFTNVTDYP